MLTFASLALGLAAFAPSAFAGPIPSSLDSRGLLGGSGGGLLDLGASGGLLATVGNVANVGGAGALGGVVGGKGGLLGLGAQGGLVANVLGTAGLQSGGSLTSVVGGAGGLLDLNAKGGLVGNVLNTVGVATGGTLDLNLGTSASTYHWTCPANWVRPTWYEFGYYHATTGLWINAQAEVVAALKLGGFLLDSHMIQPYSLFAYGPHFPTRTVNSLLKGQFGYFTQAGVFVQASLKVDLVVELLRSCGYCQKGKCY